jgi:hypothetical protein
MALDRTWYNSLIDDDGSGLTGSVWDKADVDALMDAVDAEIARLDTHPYCSVYSTVAQTLATGAHVPMTFNAELSTPASGMWVITDPTKITIPSSGLYLVQAGCTWAQNGAGARSFAALISGAPLGHDHLSDGNTTTYTVQSINETYQLNASQYLQFDLFQTSGGNLQVGGLGGALFNWCKVYRLK